MAFMLGISVTLLLGASPVWAGSIKDIEHVVIFMQENRSFNSYFGTLAGVRGFNDPNVQINPDGKPVWYQQVDPDMSTATSTLLPFHLSYLGGQWPAAVQCIVAGDNGYQDNHAAINDGLNNYWARNNTPWSWGYYDRSDLPVHFGIAESWTIGDMYQEGQVTSTNPNRVTLVSGSINAPGGPQSPDEGGVYIDNNETPGCDAPGVSCYPLKWKTIYEFYEEAGVSWQIFQDTDNFDDNPLAWFEQYQNAPANSSLHTKGMSFVGLDAFYEAAKEGTLPEVSFIVGPAELSEHPPYIPSDGAWLQQQVINAVVNSPKYSSTVLMISYDESGGFGDHVTPFHSPPNTPGDWIQDPLGLFGDVYVGPGVRLPFYIVSPWTRGGRVFTERSDHNSQILFLEEWLSAKGYKNIVTDQMVEWRRQHMSNLVNAFDFDHPDLSIPSIPVAATPKTDANGAWIGTALCEAENPVTRPPVPYGQQDISTSLVFEDGFKEVVGYLTEGRYLTFEMSGFALTNPQADATGEGHVSISRATSDHGSKSQRWVIHYYQGEESGLFTVSSALDGRWVGPSGSLLPASQGQNAAPLQFTFLGNGNGYTVKFANSKQGNAMGVSASGSLSTGNPQSSKGFSIYSVSYHD